MNNWPRARVRMGRMSGMSSWLSEYRYLLLQPLTACWEMWRVFYVYNIHTDMRESSTRPSAIIRWPYTLMTVILRQRIGPWHEWECPVRTNWTIIVTLLVFPISSPHRTAASIHQSQWLSCRCCCCWCAGATECTTVPVRLSDMFNAIPEFTSRHIEICGMLRFI